MRGRVALAILGVAGACGGGGWRWDDRTAYTVASTYCDPVALGTPMVELSELRPGAGGCHCLPGSVDGGFVVYPRGPRTAGEGPAPLRELWMFQCCLRFKDDVVTDKRVCGISD